MNKLLACYFAVVLTGTSVYGSSAQAQQLQAQQLQAQPLQAVDRIAAVVNEDVILRSELDRAVRNVLAQYASRQVQLPPRNVLERQVLERLMLVRLQVARAAETGIRVSDEEVDTAVARVAAENRLDIANLSEQLARDGMSFPDFRSTLRDEITIQRLRQAFAQSRIAVSDAEVDAALASQVAGGPQYRFAHILVALPEAATPEQIATGQQKIQGIRGLIEKGEMEFSAAAVRYSDSPNALEGGDLGWRGLEEIPRAFLDSLGSLQVGQMIGPIRGPSGFQLLRLVETRDAAQAQPRSVTQYQARHILVRSDDADSEAKARAKIETLHARIAGGADFATLASQNTDDASTRARGGDLGWFTQDTYGAELAAQVAALADGQVSAPFKTPAGWHIVQRNGSRQVTAADENRRSAIREMIGQRKLEEEWNRYLRELRGEAYVDVRTGDAATGGAAETTPVEAATPPPSTGG